MTEQTAQTEPTPSDMDKVIAKIQKLLARTKTQDGASAAEADTAMSIVQKLLLDHNLDMATIEAASAPGTTDTSRVREEIGGRTKYKWQRSLAKFVAEANFCFHLLNCERFPYTDSRPRLVRAHVFVGRRANVITARLMYTYLCETIEKLAPFTNDQRLSKAAFSWKEGAAEKVCERLAQRRADLIESHDARVQAERAARLADLKRRQAEKEAAAARLLAGNEGAEVKAKIETIGADARDRSGPVPDADPDPERPEEDESDDFNPADLEEQPEDESSTAMVLASVYDESEKEANYELAHGLEAGSLARSHKRREEREAQWAKEREEEAKKEATQAAEQTVAAVEKPIKEETERQREARERREEKEYEANTRRWARDDDRAAAKHLKEYRRLDRAQYRAGAEKGETIGLDLQVGASASKPKRIGDGK